MLGFKQGQIVRLSKMNSGKEPLQMRNSDYGFPPEIQTGGTGFTGFSPGENHPDHPAILSQARPFPLRIRIYF